MTHDHDRTVAEMMAGLERLLRAVDLTTSPTLAAWDTPVNHALRALATQLLMTAYPDADPHQLLDSWFERGAHPGDLAHEMHPAAVAA